MKRVETDLVTLLDCEPRGDNFLEAVAGGLSSDPKTLPCKYFYDEAGSRLFDAICDCEEYYLTRAELAIMSAHVAEMVVEIGPRCRLVELGSGSSIKTRVLLDHLIEPVDYLPVDISRDHLLKTAEALARRYRGIPIRPVCADYNQRIRWLPRAAGERRTVAYFPGSTIGNFAPHEAVAFLARIRQLCGPRGGLLIGVDLVKDVDTLWRAYNDARGVTAAFNKNLLVRINRELGGDFDVSQFRHRASWDPERCRIVMQLVSAVEQTVQVGEHVFDFAAGEAITTEYSHKFTLRGFAALAQQAGFDVAKVWTDPERRFSVQWCEAQPDGAL